MSKLPAVCIWKWFSFEYPRLNITESKSAGKRCLSLTTRPALTSLQQSHMGYSEFLMTRAGFHRCHFFLMSSVLVSVYLFISTSLHHLHFNYPAFEWISSRLQTIPSFRNATIIMATIHCIPSQKCLSLNLRSSIMLGRSLTRCI